MTAFDGALFCERAGLYLGPVVLMLLFGHQGWLLWQRGQMIVTWALSSARMISWNLHLGECILRRHAD